MSDENNIFYFHQDARLCAEWLHDKHTVKMLPEAKRLLAHAIQLQIVESDERLGQDRVVGNQAWLSWVLQSVDHIGWLYSYVRCLSDKLESVFSKRQRDWQFNIAVESYLNRFQRNGFIEPPQIVPDDCHCDVVTEGYRKFYLRCKVKAGSYKRVKMPYWVRDDVNAYQPDNEYEENFGLEIDGLGDIIDS